MGKKRIIQEITNLLAVALRHKIGSIVNQNEIYAQRYAKDAEVLINEAKKITFGKNFNNPDKLEIKNKLKFKLQKELQSKDFLNNKKYDFMDSEINSVLSKLGLN